MANDASTASPVVLIVLMLLASLNYFLLVPSVRAGMTLPSRSQLCAKTAGPRNWPLVQCAYPFGSTEMLGENISSAGVCLEGFRSRDGPPDGRLTHSLRFPC
jgi:hypothetical protein